MNINKITDDITYYNDITDTFEEERNALRTAGIWSIRGLLEPEEGTFDLWVNQIGVEHIHGEMWIPDNEVSDKRS